MAARVTVITGASSGLGLALARSLAGRGDAIAMLARNPVKLRNAADSLHELLPQATIESFALDVVDDSAVAQAMEQVVARLGGIDLLVNCAGVMREGYFEDISHDDFRNVLDINVMGPVSCTRAALPHLRRSRGQVVNIASMASHTGVFGYTAYCASKHALKGFTESLYHELTPLGVTVQLVCPPEFESPMADALAKGRTAENAAHTLMIPREPLDVIVRDTLRAIDTGRYHTITGWRARIMGFAVQHFPALSRRLAQREIRRARAANS